MRKMCIPFHENGDLAEYVGFLLTDEEVENCYLNGTYQTTDKSKPWHDKIIWRPNTPFHASLRYTGYERGRSSVRFVYRDEHGHKQGMFLTDADNLIKASMWLDYIDGTFEYVKRGQNYGIKFIGL